MKNICKIAVAFVAFSGLFSSCVSDLDPQGGYVDNLPRINVGVQFGVAPMIDTNGTTIPFDGSGNSSIDNTDRPQKLAPLDVDTIRINNVWVFQFGRAEGSSPSTTEANWVLIGNPYYARAEDLAAMYADPNRVLSLPMIETGITKNPGDKNWVMFIANTDDPYFTSNRLTGLQVGITKYSDFKEKYIDITDEAYAYGGEGHSLMMTGGALSAVKSNIIIDGDNDEPDDNIFKDGVMLYRNVAMIRLNLTIDQTLTPGYKVLSVQMKSVNRRMFILYNWIYDQGTFNYLANFPNSNSTSTQFFDYDVAYQDGGFQKDGTKEYVWYVPASNLQNNVYSGNSPTVQTKNAIAPSYATRYEIVVVDTIKYETIKYTIYPGLNETNDFRLFPNYIYTNDFRIFGNGGETILDSRVSTLTTDMSLFDVFMGDYTTPPDMDKANAFMVPTGRTSKLITSDNVGYVPDYIDIPISQVNRYWSGNTVGYGNDLTKTIDNDTVWVVDLLWQDDPNIVRPVGSAGANNITITASGAENSFGVTKTLSANDLGAIGKGQNAKFRINTGGGNATRGNFVVAIRKAIENGDGEFEATGDILWSWHFWVTTYNPDELVAQYENAIDGHKFIYRNYSQQIERYGGTLWGYGGTAGNNWSNYSYDYTTPSNTNPYAKSFIMDRSLGARSSSYIAYSASQSNFPMYYMYGRKDPFPYAYVYNINGTTITSTAPEDFPAQRWNSYNPVTISAYLTMSATIGQPMLNPTTTSWTNETFTNYLWYDSKLFASTSALEKSIYDPCPAGWHMPVINTWADFRYSQTINNAARGFAYANNAAKYYPYYTPDGGVTYPVEGTIVYPGSGYRYSGSMQGVGSYAYHWTATPSGIRDGYYWYLYSGSSVGYSTISSYYGWSARCVSMPR